MNLKPIKPKRISDQVFEQIRELIYKGEFKGEKRHGYGTYRTKGHCFKEFFSFNFIDC